MPSGPDYASLLREAGLRATPGRLALLDVLHKETRPLAVHQIEKKMHGSVNQVTLYRALDALAASGIIARVNLEHDHAHFELVAGRSHHHHAVCSDCGAVEDIEVPHGTGLEKLAARAATGFESISRYSLEFFGLCKRCAGISRAGA